MNIRFFSFIYFLFYIYTAKEAGQGYKKRERKNESGGKDGGRRRKERGGKVGVNNGFPLFSFIDFLQQRWQVKGIKIGSRKKVYKKKALSV